MRQWSAGGALNCKKEPVVCRTRGPLTHTIKPPLPTTSGFLRYFRAYSLSPVRQGTPRVPQGTWGVLWGRNVCPYWMLMEFPISLYVMVGLLAHIPTMLTPTRPPNHLPASPDDARWTARTRVAAAPLR